MKSLIFVSALAISSLGIAATATSNVKSTMNETKTSMNEVRSEGATQLDDLIRGEMAAVRTYNEVLTKVTNPDEMRNLNSMKKDHMNAVATLKRYASPDVKEDTMDSGIWGGFAKTFTKGASLFGDKTALRALNQGEEHGIREYREALEDENVSPEVKKIIRSSLLPKQEEHVKAFKNYL